MAMTFRELTDLVVAQTKRPARLQQFLAKADALYWERAEWAFGALARYAEAQGLTVASVLETYAAASPALERLVEFRRTGRYPDAALGQAGVKARHYDDRAAWRKAMIALGLSVFLWPHHYRLYDFFVECVDALGPTVRSYLEVGPGHGIHLATAARSLEGATLIEGIDIAEASLEMTREIAAHFGVDGRVKLVHQDAMHMAPDVSFDLVTAGEIIEHLDDPGTFLRTLAASLAPAGHMFVTTCANCPDATHVYQFDDVDQIRRFLEGAGFRIERERIAPAVDLPPEELARRRASISYAALLSKAP